MEGAIQEKHLDAIHQESEEAIEEARTEGEGGTTPNEETIPKRLDKIWRDNMKEEISEREWTDGVGKALKTIGSMIEKKERMSHDADEDYVSDPRILIKDLVTGSELLVIPGTSEGGKTRGHGYRKCKSVTQTVASKLPTKKIIGRLMSLVIRNFVPKDAPAEQYSVMVQNAIEEVAKSIADDEQWDDNVEDYGPAVSKAISDLLEHTTTRRAGDSLLNMRVVGVTTYAPPTLADVQLSGVQQIE